MKIVTRIYSKSRCDAIETLTGIRVTGHRLEKHIGQKPRVLQTFVSKINQ